MTTEPSPKSSGFKLTAINTLVATLAGIISITGGIYSLKNSIFQTQGEGRIAGMIRDEAIARPLKDASVEISDNNNFVIGTLYTDQSGHYETGKLKEGPYIVKVSTIRHVPQTKTITVMHNQTSKVNFDLTALEEKTEPVYQPVPPVPFSDNPRPIRQVYGSSSAGRYPVRAYPGPQRDAGGSNVSQTLMQTGLQLLGDYMTKRNQTQKAGTSQNNQSTNTNQNSQNPYSKEAS